MIELIPAIDMMTRKVYNEDPLEVAKQFEDHGIRRLHMVDLDGAKAGHIVNYKMLEKVAGHTGLTIDFGGGLKRDEDLRIAFDCGAQMVTGGSIAVKNPDSFLSWLKQYGSERIILGADAKDRKIAVNGWEEGTALDLIKIIRRKESGRSSARISGETGCCRDRQSTYIRKYRNRFRTFI